MPETAITSGRKNIRYGALWCISGIVLLTLSYLGGWQDALRLAYGYGFHSVGTGRPEPCVCGMWARDVYL
jgi:hypothetical protein